MSIPDQAITIAILIVETLEHRNPLDDMGFYPRDVYQPRYHRLKQLWPGNRNIKEVAGRYFRILLEHGELTQPGGDYTKYYLAEDGVLYSELKKRQSQKISSSGRVCETRHIDSEKLLSKVWSVPAIFL